MLHSGESCWGCKGAGSFLVAQPALECAGCGGGGLRPHIGSTCDVCKGSGWAQALPLGALNSPFGSAVPSGDANAKQPDAISEGDKHIAKQVFASTDRLVSDIFFAAYAVGYILAVGMNWADPKKNFLECLFYSLLSWANVGYLLALG